MNRIVGVLVGASLVSLVACGGGSAPGTDPASSAAVTGEAGGVVGGVGNTVVVGPDGLDPAWSDMGWSSTVADDGLVRIDLGDSGGWTVTREGLDGDYASLRLTVETVGDFILDSLSLQVADQNASVFPVVVAPLSRAGTRGTTEVTVGQLDPGRMGFDRLTLTATDPLPAGSIVEVTTLFFTPSVPAVSTTAPSSGTASPGTAATAATPAPTQTDAAGTESASTDPSVVATDPATAAPRGMASINCAAPTTPISQHIYGIAQEFGNMPDEDWSIGATSRRWGGNASTRYNWRTGHWNTAFDYYFQNVSDDGGTPPHQEFLAENAGYGLSSALTIPTIGWVAKDDTSGGFPVSVFGEQQDVDPYRSDLGNGVSTNGDELGGRGPAATSVAFSPADAAAWVSQLNFDARNGGAAQPFLYYLDNEPMLWNSTHRDMVTEPVGYDELLQRTIDYASAIRSAQPNALIGGPSVWGWPAYFFSAIDAEAGFSRAPDRRAHDNTPLIEWYLDELRAHEAATGVRLLDVLDVHFYPQDGTYSDDIDDGAVARRLRTTRSLWDRNYLEESWIEDNVALIPRMQDWVDEHYPGTLLSIGEYSFGAEEHISGGLAQAEALGRFGQNGLFAAYYWTVPPTNSPVYWAFRAFLNYDGNGSAFGDHSVPTTFGDAISLFASETSAGDRNVAVIVNASPDPIASYSIDAGSCGRSAAAGYQYGASSSGLGAVPVRLDDGVAFVDVPGYSITVVELT